MQQHGVLLKDLNQKFQILIDETEATLTSKAGSEQRHAMFMFLGAMNLGLEQKLR